jgi:3-O-alpha-D-mannopyranosyl-alpha-D-mannopyranose xylosylphosphotransferase
MMDEASIMFAEELSIASTRGFRESKRGTADIEMAALASWLRIERWREALLWTWIVGKVGGVEGVWDGGRAKEELRYLFGNGLEEGKNGKVRMGPRKTIEDADMYLSTNNLDEPLSTRIRFCKSPYFTP